MTKQNRNYHHGNLAESLLNAVDELATKFGIEAVTLRACAKIVGFRRRRHSVITQINGHY